MIEAAIPWYTVAMQGGSVGVTVNVAPWPPRRSSFASGPTSASAPEPQSPPLCSRLRSAARIAEPCQVQFRSIPHETGHTPLCAQSSLTSSRAHPQQYTAAMVRTNMLAVAPCLVPLGAFAQPDMAPKRVAIIGVFTGTSPFQPRGIWEIGSRLRQR